MAARFARFRRSPPGFALLVASLAVVVRGRAFLISQGDANVDASFHVGALWLKGSLPYLSAWEYKPPGLFAFDAFALALFGDPGVASAWLGTLAVIATALGARCIVRALGAGETAARVAALGVVLFSIEDQGILGDAELYVNAFVTLAFAALASPRPRLRRAAAAGLAAGCALQMKLVALPLVALLGVTTARCSPGARARCLAVYTALLLAPFVLEVLLYARADALPAFWDANVAATVRRALAVHAHLRRDNASEWLAQLRVLAPALQFAMLTALVRERARFALLWTWFAVAVATVAVAGEYYDRQFLLLVPPIAMLGAAGLTTLANASRYARPVVAAALALTFALHGYYEVAQSVRIVLHRTGGERGWHAGHYAAVRDALRAQLGNDRSLYVVQDSPMLYDDLGAPAPTRYAFSGNLLERGMWPMLGLRGRDELARILRTRPHFIAEGRLSEDLDPQSAILLQTLLRSEYRVAARVDTTTIYALRSRPAGAQSLPRRSST